MAENTENNNNEGVVLAENEIVCMLTNKVVKVSDKEQTLQYMIGKMIEEYGFAASDMERDYKVKYTDSETGTSKTQKVDLVEKARVIDPFGHAGQTPLGEIRMTLAGEIKMPPVEASAGEFFVALRLLVLARRGSISKTTEYDCKIKKHPSMLRSRNGNKRDGQYVSSFPQHSTQVRPAVHFKRQDNGTAA